MRSCYNENLRYEITQAKVNETSVSSDLSQSLIIYGVAVRSLHYLQSCSDK